MSARRIVAHAGAGSCPASYPPELYASTASACAFDSFRSFLSAVVIVESHAPSAILRESQGLLSSDGVGLSLLHRAGILAALDAVL